MAARFVCVIASIWLLTGCFVQSPPVVKIALLAPFEGRYREIGYEALYAARLAIADADTSTQPIHLLAIDAGNSAESAVQRADAIRQDPAIQGVVLLGTYTTGADVLDTLAPLPVVIAGSWGSTANGDTIYQLAPPNINEQYELLPSSDLVAIATTNRDLIGHELLSLDAFLALRGDAENNISIVSSGRFAGASFTERYRASDAFAPEPRLIAPLAYDATGILVQSILTRTPLDSLTYEGYHSSVTFNDGYWNQPARRYTYENDKWQRIEDTAHDE